MYIQQNISLLPFNTFGIDVKAAFFAAIKSTEDLLETLSIEDLQSLPMLVLGGGSNILFTTDFPGLVIRMETKGVEVFKQTPDKVYVKAMAGEDWEEFVEYCVARNWGGLENLTLIPGNVGTSPMQNIGAYGVEIKDVFHELQALEIATGKIVTFNREDCRFGYRNSFFKNEGKGKYIILSVVFCLNSDKHTLLLDYGTVKDELQSRGITAPRIQDVRDVIRHIRQSKLPDPKELGNAGSFFKNPVLDAGQFAELQRQHPDIPSFSDASGKVKTAAAWLIDRAGWKGYREGNVGVHERQALVLVNYGGATGKQVLSLAEKIRESVKEKFGVALEMEVNAV